MQHRALLVLCTAALVPVAGLPATPASAAATVDLVPVASYASSSGPVPGGSEIVAFDPQSRRAFSTNDAAGVTRVDVVDLSRPATPTALAPIELTSRLATVQSVAVGAGVLAVAGSPTTPQAPGLVLLYDAASSALLREVAVPALPDAVTFTPDGSRVVVSGEGEAACVGGALVDPPGTVSTVRVSDGALLTADFTAYDAPAAVAALRAAGVRLDPRSLPSRDLEPELAVVSDDSSTAYVTLQEANAVATVDLAAGRVTDVRGVGVQDHRVVPIDASDQDSASGTASILRRTRPLVGLTMPDGIAQLTRGGETLLLLAGEGDARDGTAACGGPGPDTARLSSSAVVLDPAFPASATVRASSGPAGFGRLNVGVRDGDTDGDGDIDQITALGSRSLRIVRPDGSLVADTGDELERTVAERFPAFFNINGESGLGTVDQRSDDKGPEPESVVVGRVAGTDLAFVALERFGGVATYDVTVPSAPVLAGLDNPAVDGSAIGRADRAPEGLAFVPADRAPGGVPLLLVSNEVSGTVTVYEVRATGTLPTAGAGGGGGGGAPVTLPSPTSSATPSPTPSPTVSRAASPAPTADVSPSASPTAAPSTTSGPFPGSSPSPRPACPTVRVLLTTASSLSGRPVGVGVTAAPGERVELLARTARDAAPRVVRVGTAGADGRAAFTLLPTTTTRVSARTAGCPVTDAGPVVAVRSDVALAATRLGARRYALTGRVLPAVAGTLVSVYRVTPAGARVLVAQASTDARGVYRVERRFLGGGLLDLVARVAPGPLAGAGESAVRPTVVR